MDIQVTFSIIHVFDMEVPDGATPEEMKELVSDELDRLIDTEDSVYESTEDVNIDIIPS